MTIARVMRDPNAEMSRMVICNLCDAPGIHAHDLTEAIKQHAKVAHDALHRDLAGLEELTQIPHPCPFCTEEKP